MNNSFFSPRRLLMLAAALILVVIVYFSLRPKPIISPDQITVQLPTLPKSMNPYLTTSAYTLNIASRIQQTLAVFDPRTSTLQPVLIKSIPAKRMVTEGAYKGMHVYDFEILKEARWDNGTSVTAADVSFTLKLIFQRAIPELGKWRRYFETMKAFETDPSNPLKFSIYFEKPYILELESVCQVPIMPAYTYDPNNSLKDISLSALLVEKPDSQLLADPRFKAFADNFADPKYSNDLNFIGGSGPYRLKLLTDQVVILEKKENWWGNTLSEQYPMLAAYPKTIQFRLIMDDATLETMLKTREIDLAHNMNATKFLQWKSDTAISNYYNFEQGWAPSYNRIVINMANPKLSDKRVRQAIAYATDYDYIFNKIFQGLGSRIVGPINPVKAYYNKNVPLYQLDIPKAKALLAEAGWTDTNGDGIVDKDLGDGTRTELQIKLMSANTVKYIEEATNSLHDSYKQAGIDLVVESVSLTTMITRYTEGTFDLGLSAGYVNTGLDDFYQILHTKSLPPNGDNRSRFSNAEVDKLLEDINASEDEQARNKMYLRLQEIIHEEVPELYLCATNQRYIVAKKFDYVLSPERPGYFEYLFHLK
ncbi:MAG: ABC transporter substrate-binding protein [Bacteroidota bacterium]